MSGRLIPVAAVLLALLLAFIVSAGENRKNGFDLTQAIVDVNAIEQGGPPKDGIPAIDNPTFVTAGQADFLRDGDKVLGITLGGEARAYPINILNWHEVVNDRIGAEPVVISFCPLCGTGVAFSAVVAGRTLDFGVSGLLYNSDVLFYDRQTDSLWSQIWGRAVSGELAGQPLTLLPISHTTWQRWRSRNPSTLVLSTETGYERDYGRNPYQGYEESRRLYFKVTHQAPADYHPKERVLGVSVDGVFKAYPFRELNRQGRARFTDKVNGRRLTILWDVATQSGEILDSKGQPIVVIQGFWFAWFAFHPQTQVFIAP